MVPDWISQKALQVIIKFLYSGDLEPKVNFKEQREVLKATNFFRLDSL